MWAAQVAAAERQGLKVIVGSGGRSLSDWPLALRSPALWGYQLQDEPSSKDFGWLRNLSVHIAARRPDALQFVCLLPNIGTPQQFIGRPCQKSEPNCAATAYDQYLSRFVSTFKPRVLIMDHYPYWNRAEKKDVLVSIDTRDAYRQNLASLRTAAAAAGRNTRTIPPPFSSASQPSVAAGIPFWNFFHGSMPFGSLVQPTEAQVRWQVMTSLACEAQPTQSIAYIVSKLRFHL